MTRELSHRQRAAVLVVCCMSLFVVGLDATIVNVALPSIGHDLHARGSGLQWTVDAYTLVAGSFLMLSGSTGDRTGRRRMFQAGLALFTAGSLLCSLAPTLGALVAFRMVQALGGSMLNPCAMSIITNTFPQPAERARAIGVWGAVWGISMALGPIIGGALVDSVGWRGIFWVNVPVGIAVIVATALLVPESRAARARRADPAGQAIVIALLASLIYGIIEGPDAGWTSPRILGCFAAAAAMIACLVVYTLRRADPLIDLRFFRSAPFAGATVLAVCAFASLGGFLFLTTLYLQDARGLSALQAGLYVLPMAATTALTAPLAGRMVATRGPRGPVVVAGIALAVSGLMLTRLATGTPASYLLVSYVIFGIGSGLVNTPITNAAVSGMPRAQAGVAAGLASTSRQVGAALGVAVAGSVVFSALHGPLRLGFAAASHAGWWIIAGCGVVTVAVGLASTGSWAKMTAERNSSALLPPASEAPAAPRDPMTLDQGMR